MEDLGRLEGDEGFCRVLRRVELDGMSRRERRDQEKRWRKERRREAALGGLWGECRLVVDHDPGAEPKPDNETLGVGQELGQQVT